MPITADQHGLVRNAISCVRLAMNFGWLTDTNIAAADTVTGLRDAVTNSTASPTEAMAKPSVDKAIVALAAVGIFSDALILGLTTKADLLALAGDDDPGWASKYDE